jgi:hypothetical protein
MGVARRVYLGLRKENLRTLLGFLRLVHTCLTYFRKRYVREERISCISENHHFHA